MAVQAEPTISPARRLGRLPRQQQVKLGFWQGITLALLLAALWAGYVFSGQPVTLIINDQPRQVRTHQATVATALQNLRVNLKPQDIIQPPPDTPLANVETITIQLARPVSVQADGRTWQLLTHHQTVSQILAETGLSLNPRDEIYIDGIRVEAAAPLPPPQPAPSTSKTAHLLLAATPGGAVTANRPHPIQLMVQRAVPITLNDERARSTFYTARATVGQALQEQGITLFPEDRVTPPLDTPLAPGLHIFIERSTPVTIIADGRTIQTRTHQPTVGSVLAQAGLALMGQDFSRPAAAEKISANDIIQVVRVRETFEIEEELIPFETKWVPDDQMQLDQRQVRQTGATGVIKTRTRVRYENGQEIWRIVEDEWLDQNPSDHIIAYGTNIVIRTLETENGPIEYWRRISMLTTAYSAATSGKDADHPRYGITRSGLPAGYGVVAVDPKVIPLMTRLYVPGYGQAIAGDTGGRVIGKHVDLGYNETPPLMYEWRDVYILTPVPPADKIRYVLPQWPQQ